MPLLLAATARRDDGDSPHVVNGCDDGVGVVSLVGKYGLGAAALKQGQGFWILRRLTGGEPEGQRFSETVGE